MPRWFVELLRTILRRFEDGQADKGVEIPRSEKGGGDSSSEKEGSGLRAAIISGKGAGHGPAWLGLVAYACTGPPRAGTDEPKATWAELGEALPIVIVLPEIPLAIPPAQRRIIRSLEPEAQWIAVEHYNAALEYGIRIQFNSGRRTPDEQAALNRRTKAAVDARDSTIALDTAGLSGFAAPSTKSLHVFGLAYDGEPFPKNEQTWRKFGELAENLGATWGGRWKRTLADGTVRTDRPHVQVGVPLERRAAIMAAAAAGVAVVSAAVVVSRALRE